MHHDTMNLARVFDKMWLVVVLVSSGTTSLDVLGHVRHYLLHKWIHKLKHCLHRFRLGKLC